MGAEFTAFVVNTAECLSQLCYFDRSVVNLRKALSPLLEAVFGIRERRADGVYSGVQPQ